MCTNFRPPARLIVSEMFDFPAPAFDYPEEAWPGYAAPVVRRSLAGRYESMRGVFGLIPFWARDASIGRRTYNARSETVAGKPAFRGAWKRSQRALVPMDRFYEPDWTSGKAVRWRIERRDSAPFAVAALWERWDDKTRDEVVESFTLLTINADQHPVMGRFHRPGDEKRSLVPIAREDWAAWLDDDPESAFRLLLPMQPEQYTSAADPLIRSAARGSSRGLRSAGKGANVAGEADEASEGREDDGPGGTGPETGRSRRPRKTAASAQAAFELFPQPEEAPAKGKAPRS